MAKKKTLPLYDDGRTIAKMNVEGMPWHMNVEGFSEKPKDSKASDVFAPEKGETLSIVISSLLAALLIVAIFAVVIGAFILLLFIFW